MLTCDTKLIKPLPHAAYSVHLFTAMHAASAHSCATCMPAIFAMPRQNTCPTHFPEHILAQIKDMALHIVATRKARGQTQAQWAEKLGISQPTMARIERGDPAIATATYLTCLWMVNPLLNLQQLLTAPSAQPIAPSLLNPPKPTVTHTHPEGHKPDNAAYSIAQEFSDLLAQWREHA